MFSAREGRDADGFGGMMGGTPLPGRTFPLGAVPNLESPSFNGGILSGLFNESSRTKSSRRGTSPSEF